MKTVIYYNVNSGEAFDSEGRLRSANNPLTVTYGEKRIFEWHLVTDTAGSLPESWTQLNDFEVTPSIASLATDNNYISAFKGIFVSVVNGAVSELSVQTSASEENIPGSGQLRLKKADGTEIEISYFSVVKTLNTYVFSVNENLTTTEFLTSSPVDILKQPMAKASTFLVDLSDPQNGVFAFAVLFRSEKLKKLFEYSDTESVETKGLELRVAGLDSSNQRMELAGAIVPLTILGILDQTLLPQSVSTDILNSYQTWTLALVSAGLEVQFSVDSITWNSTSVGAWYFRMRPAGVTAAQWSIAIPIPQPKTDPDHVEHAFTVASDNTLDTIEIPYTELNVVKPFDSSLFEVQADNSELNITHNTNLQMFFTASTVKLCWNGTFPAGTYVIRG